MARAGTGRLACPESVSHLDQARRRFQPDTPRGVVTYHRLGTDCIVNIPSAKRLEKHYSPWNYPPEGISLRDAGAYVSCGLNGCLMLGLLSNLHIPELPGDRPIDSAPQTQNQGVTVWWAA